ncbi:MAG: glycosyltransferase [Candidatus Viridilinea halotolerans]|uniref:Glycosyltransferase n=1 Tax=Candidatus Viridilinea halotolerans TaxID=2491704 RepID=A0A426TVL3_9CHLR|nr:MAG: glycosyltransferase [Candidatus Viridilinea halotolerans]
MNPLHLTFSDGSGGADRAALRLHQAMLQQGVASRMQVALKERNDPAIEGSRSEWQRSMLFNRSRVASVGLRLQRPADHNPRSLALLPSGRVHRLNREHADLLHFHWICGEMLSVEDIGRLRKPLVWTLHDMWPFCGAEHYATDGPEARWRHGYTTANRPAAQRGLDLDRWVWQRKQRAWRRPIHLVAPSQWMADCARASALMHDWPVRVIPNPLALNAFRPVPQPLARQLLNLPPDQPLVLFGAIGGGQDQRKGWDLLQATLAQLAGTMPNVAGVIFGQTQPPAPPRLGLPLYWMGHMHDDLSLALLYSACDVMVVPSRLDNLPQTGTEAQACGCPVVAFNVGGLPSVVEHQQTGYLAQPFAIDDLAAGIAWVLESAERQQRLAAQARARAERLWAPEVVVAQYREVYQRALGAG